MASKGTTEPGFVNRNGQINLGSTERPSTTPLQPDNLCDALPSVRSKLWGERLRHSCSSVPLSPARQAKRAAQG